MIISNGVYCRAYSSIHFWATIQLPCMSHFETHQKGKLSALLTPWHWNLATLRCDSFNNQSAWLIPARIRHCSHPWHWRYDQKSKITYPKKRQGIHKVNECFAQDQWNRTLTAPMYISLQKNCVWLFFIIESVTEILSFELQNGRHFLFEYKTAEKLWTAMCWRDDKVVLNDTWGSICLYNVPTFS